MCKNNIDLTIPLNQIIDITKCILIVICKIRFCDIYYSISDITKMNESISFNDLVIGLETG